MIHKTLTPELPIWGGFFAGKDNYYFVYGQNNLEESDNVEVIRVVKYSKDWKRLSNCSISGVNTYQPFKSGTLRIDETNGKLIIYGSHTMYDDGDSLHHQSNMTFIIDENTMALHSSYYKMTNINNGYVSHSFNQFVKADGNTLYRVDLSDNHLRGVPITKADINSISKCSYNNAFVDKGSFLKNGTLVGITLNGFELSDNNCIIAGCSVDQDASPWSAFGQYNIFIDIVDKDSLKSEVKWITNYNDNSNINVNRPVLIKQNNDLFAVMWEEIDSNNTISTKLVTINSSGEILSNINKINVRLSDCQPIITSDGNITWYYTENSSPIFYSLNLNDYSEFRKEVNWDFNKSTSTLTISCDGMMPHYSANNQPWNQYNSEVETIILKSGIENISNNAFYGMKNLKNIVIPSTVKSIGGSAFNGCFAMAKIDLPNSITKIEDMAFYRCTNMLDITFDKNINSIGKYAFGYAWDMNRNPAIISNQVKIYGYEDTTAEEYALNNKIKFMPLNSITSTNTTTTTSKLTATSSTSTTTAQTSTTSTTTAIPTTTSATSTSTTTAINVADSKKIKELEDKISVLESENAALKEEVEQLKFTFTVNTFGDIDGNNIIDGRDASIILTFYAKTSTGFTGTLTDFIESTKTES